MTTGNSEDGLGQRLHQATDPILEIKHQVGKNLGHHIDSLGALIRKRPIVAIGIGLGLGYLIARMVHR